MSKQPRRLQEGYVAGVTVHHPPRVDDESLTMLASVEAGIRTIIADEQIPLRNLTDIRFMRHPGGFTISVLADGSQHARQYQFEAPPEGWATAAAEEIRRREEERRLQEEEEAENV